MSEQGRSGGANRLVLRDSAVYFSAQLGARALNFIYFLVLARSLPTDEFGVLNYVLTIIVTLDIVIDLGLSRHAMREISRDPGRAQEFLARLLPYKMAAAALVYALYCLWVLTLEQPLVYTLIAVFSALGLFFTSPAMLLENVVQAYHRFTVISTAHVALAVAQFALGGVILLAGGGAVAISLIFAFTYLLYGAILAAELRRLGLRFRPAPAPRAILRSLPASLPYLISALIILLAIKTEFLVFGYFGTPVELGLFGMAVKIVEAGMLLPLALGGVMAPRFAKAHAQGRETLGRLYFSAFEVLAALAIGSAIVAFLLTPVVPLILPEPGFVGIDRVLRLLFFGYPVACIFVFNTFFLFGASRQRGPLALLVALAVLQLGLNGVLQSRYGLTGAALSFTVFMALAAVLSTGFIMAVYIGMRGLRRSVMAPLGASLLAALFYLLSSGWPDSVRLIVALAIFGAAYLGAQKYLPGHTTRIDLGN
ncbi:hypothetical protein D6850_07640 [Roseovarius spongiae]|uniref:Uncharacterized protein n=1 Tax=Roseovarius spongiae TaxID=2320272 RepID=A0A3A8B9E3_9RHOB|nr:oligosaccharide flippase family protein [Roseovarius spongiae]RKF14743.1 hypothetical protein D6850_07640 [Roseovarius spongiae]